MRKRLEPLLCELHAHTTWSDGDLSLAQLVDLHGQRGIDVLCVTDHVVRDDDPWRDVEGVEVRAVDETTWGGYLANVEREAARALALYGMLVVPGLELTFNHRDPHEAAHAVAVGLRGFVSLEVASRTRCAPLQPRARRSSPRIRSSAATHGQLAPADVRLRRETGAPRPRAPLRALQPLPPVRMGRRGGAACGRRRRRPPRRAPHRLADAGPLRAERAGARGIPPVTAAGLLHPPRSRPHSSGCLADAPGSVSP
jgi:hypothetical protein